MRKYLGLALCLGLWGLATTVLAQVPYEQRSVYDSRSGIQADPPPPDYAPPRQPILQRRDMSQPAVAGPNPQQSPAVPFQLAPQEQAQVDRVLQVWEQRSALVKTFECRFTRFRYDAVFGNAQQPLQDQGDLKYASPDKGLFRIEGQQPEQWICDGKSIFQFDYQNKKVIEHKLPPEMQGAAIADGPIPFLFGAKAQTLKERYWLRLVTPQENAANEIWIEAYPRRPQEKQNFDSAEIILSAQTMLPTAINLWEANRKNHTVYAFSTPRVNPVEPMKHLDPLNLFNNNPFRPSLPGRDWTLVVGQPPTHQADTTAYPPPRPRR